MFFYHTLVHFPLPLSPRGIPVHILRAVSAQVKVLRWPLGHRRPQGLSQLTACHVRGGISTKLQLPDDSTVYKQRHRSLQYPCMYPYVQCLHTCSYQGSVNWYVILDLIPVLVFWFWVLPCLPWVVCWSPDHFQFPYSEFYILFDGVFS